MQRVTIILGVDLLKNKKANPLAIFKGNTERSIKKINSKCNKTYQRNAWCTETEFIEFISSLPKDKKILLICDNFKAHKTETVLKFLENEYPLLKIKYLPPNTTSILQPLDVGINKTFKSYIKKKYIEWLYEYYEANKKIPKFKITERSNLFLSWISESWKEINNELIQNSFKFCGYLNPKEKYDWEKFYVDNK